MNKQYLPIEIKNRITITLTWPLILGACRVKLNGGEHRLFTYPQSDAPIVLMSPLILMWIR